MKDVQLRDVNIGDFNFLFNLHRTAFKPYIDQTWGWEEEWQLTYFRSRFDPDIRKMIQFQGRDVGCISVQDQGNALFIAYIAISPTYRRRGIGSSLIQKVIREAEERGIPVRLQSLKVNPVRELYERLGFRIIGSTETHILMEK
jgi:ribosomal protein S18 acetylase RimI-like enzyme